MAGSQLRPIDEADIDAIVALSLRAWEPVFESFERVFGPELYARFYPDWRSHQAASVRAALATNETWVGEVDARVAGFVNVVFNREALSGEIYMIAVDPEFQRRRIAAELSDFALEEMRRRGMTLAMVSTGGDPGHAPARHLYEAVGFTAFPQVLYSKLLEPD